MKGTLLVKRNAFICVSTVFRAIFPELHAAHLQRSTYCLCTFCLVASLMNAPHVENKTHFYSRSCLLFDGSFCHRVLLNSHSCAMYSVSTMLSIYKERRFISRTKHPFPCITTSIGGIFLRCYTAYLQRWVT